MSHFSRTGTQTFMSAAAGFVAHSFPIFLLGAYSASSWMIAGSVRTIADFMTQKLGPSRAALAVVLAVHW